MEPRPQLLGERAACDWLRPGSPPLNRRGLGCGRELLGACGPRGSLTPWVQLCRPSGHALGSKARAARADDWQLWGLAGYAWGWGYRTVADLWTAIGGAGVAPATC